MAECRSCIISAKGALPVGAVTIETPPADLEVFADPLFEKVFYNLLDNSLRYGGGEMKVIRVQSQKEDGELILSYEDDGVGISPDEHVHLFERGFGKHSGFGLFLSKEILSITGITIEETGTPGKGVRFVMHIPAGMCRSGSTGSP